MRKLFPWIDGVIMEDLINSTDYFDISLFQHRIDDVVSLFLTVNCRYFADCEPTKI